MSEKSDTEPETKSLWDWLKQCQMAVYIIVSVLAFGFQMMRQSSIEQRLADAEKSAVHRTETAFSVLISGMLQSATIIENNLVETKQHNLVLIACAKQKNCPSDVLVQKEQKAYVPIAQHYFNAKQEMIKRSENEH